MNPLKYFMEPESVAILGASSRPGSISALVVKNLLKFGYQGPVYLVNPRGEELFGLKFHARLLDIEGPVDLVVIYLPAAAMVEAIEACVQKGVRAAVVVTDGLDVPWEGETTITKKMVEVAGRGGLRIMGPNSMGVINVSKKFSTSFASFDSLSTGKLSIISQTGLFTGAALSWLITSQRLGVSMSIDLANKCDVDELDSLEYLMEDPETKVIGMHIEEVTDGKRFIETARKISPKKPILALKPGRTESGARAVASHTGSMAGRDELYTAAFTQSGVIRVNDMEDLADLAKAFIHLPPLKGPNVGVVTFTGGWGALSADVFQEYGLAVARISETTRRTIQDISPAWRKITNPVDMWPPAKLDAAETYQTSIRALVEDPGVDAVLVIAPAMDNPIFDVIGVIRDESTRSKDKPIVTWAVGHKESVERAKDMIESDCLFYPTVTRAVRALAALYQYERYREYDRY
ncbi:MAG: CoA-binding protein [Deltaproteobacteria bacterium]|nr:CoA-binding protein [Deltaproteobacteria bacterium]